MSDIYEEEGAWLVSGDYEGNLEEIAKALNGLLCDQDDEQDRRFVVRNGRIKSIGRFPAREVGLAELSTTISPLLTCGTLMLTAVRTDKTGESWFDRFAIRSDGLVQDQIKRWHKGSMDTYQLIYQPWFSRPRSSKRQNPKSEILFLKSMALTSTGSTAGATDRIGQK
jgi:hypothetical protein